MTREQQKKLLLAEGALHRFECVQARRTLAESLGGIAQASPSGMLRAVSGRSLLGLVATALPLLLGAGRISRWLKRGMLVAGGVGAVWSAIRRWREQPADADDPEAAHRKAGQAARPATPQAATDDNAAV